MINRLPHGVRMKNDQKCFKMASKIDQTNNTCIMFFMFKGIFIQKDIITEPENIYNCMHDRINCIC